jgi:FkbM family methyltransferase
VNLDKKWKFFWGFMKSFSKLKSDYKTGLMPKDEFIEEAYSTLHGKLHEIADQLFFAKINSITLSQSNIVAEIGELNFKYALVKGDMRNCAVESLNFEGFEPKDSWIIYKILRIMSKHASLGAEGLFFDIGSNNGWYSLYASTLSGIEVHSFEPIKATYENLLLNLKLNNFTKVNHYNFGLSDKSGVETFYVDPCISGKSSLAKLPGLSHKNTERCKLESLDGFVDIIKKPPNFIKVDVEGAELSVIKGGIDVIKKNKPVIYVELLRKWGREFGYHPQEVLDLLFVEGYQCFFSSKANELIEIKEINEKTVATNFLFLNKQHNDLKQDLCGVE